ncbi:MAG: carboxymuconolactone decarboxylase family protein [Acidimicrobiales bacterium]
MDVRVPPLPQERLGPLARLVGRGAALVTAGDPPHIFSTLGRHRRLLRAWLPFAGTMLMRTRLPRTDVELVVLRTACNCASPYEWAQHVSLARRSGLHAEVIAAVPGWTAEGGGSTLTARQRILLAATDDLNGRRVVTTDNWKPLAYELDEGELIELCMLVGHYEMVAMTLNSLGVEPDASSVRSLDQHERETFDLLQARATSLASDSQL